MVDKMSSKVEQGASLRVTELSDLDDRCLLTVLCFLNPLPDLFRVAAVSKVPCCRSWLGPMYPWHATSLCVPPAMLCCVPPCRLRYRSVLSAQRLCALVSDERMWLRVSHDARPRLGFCRGAHPTLRAAVEASRPGDTIVVEPGAWHEARDVAVRWPLRIVGGGDAPADTVLHCPRGADAALDFRWTG